MGFPFMILGKSIRLSPSIISIFLLLMVPAFVALIIFVYLFNERTATSTSRSLIDRFKLEAVLSVNDLINPMRVLVSSAASLGNVDPNFFAIDGSWDYLKSMVSPNPSSLSAYVGLQDGSFRQTRRVTPGTKIQDKAITDEMRFGYRWISKERTTEIYRFIDETGKSLGESSARTNYDPRTRPWYREAVAKKKLVLTDPYIFSTTGLPGLTIAAPFYANNAVAGVVATDISLESISKFLATQAVSERSLSIIFDAAGLIIASSVEKDNFRKVNNRVELNSLSTLSTNLPSLAIAMRVDKESPLLVFNHPETGMEYVAVFAPVPDEFEKPWTILSITPMDDFRKEFSRTNKIIFYFGLFLIFAQIFLIYVYARKIAGPLEEVTKSIQNLIDFKLPAHARITSGIYELASLSGAVKKLAATITAFTSYIPRDLVNDLLSTGKPIEIGGESRYLTILFTDLKDFSSLSESTPSRDLLRRVSSYFELMTHAIKEENGTVDKFIGDAVMAFWGAPLLDERHAYHACVAAIKSQRRMQALNAQLAAEGKPPLYVRIGIHSDAVLVGNIGSVERLSYTVMGDGVNIASRLEGVNKEYGTQICVSHSVFKEAGERLWLRPIDQITVKGRKGELIIYEALGTRDGSEETQASEIQQQVCLLSEKAFGFFMNRQYREATTVYARILEIDETDPVARVMLRKCGEQLDAVEVSSA
jgi:adenylate cyclase